MSNQREEYYDEARRALVEYRDCLALVIGPCLWKDVADALHVSESSISRARNTNEMPAVVLHALREAGYIGPLPPKDPRPRVWMRTDDINSALKTFRDTYPDYNVIVALKLMSSLPSPTGDEQ